MLHLLWTFAQLSVLGFGGGKGIIPQMHADAVTRYHWVTSQQFTQFYTIGKLVPGPTTIFAALIGYAAIAGPAVARRGVPRRSRCSSRPAPSWWPSTRSGSASRSSPWRTIISQGLAPAIVGLGLVQRLDDRARRSGRAPWHMPLTAVVAVLMLRSKISAPLLILLSGGVGVVALR